MEKFSLYAIDNDSNDEDDDDDTVNLNSAISWSDGKDHHRRHAYSHALTA